MFAWPPHTHTHTHLVLEKFLQEIENANGILKQTVWYNNNKKSKHLR